MCRITNSSSSSSSSPLTYAPPSSPPPSSHYRIANTHTYIQAEAAAIEVAAETVRKREAACRNLDAHSLLSGIRVFRVHDQTELVAVVGQLERYVTANPRVKLVVIDSVAFHFRHDIREGDINRRT